MILWSIINIHFKQTFSTLSKLKHLCISFWLTILFIQTQASSLGLLITSVINFHSNLVVMFVHFLNQFSVINSIYMKQLVLVYNIVPAIMEEHILDTWAAK